MKHRHKDECKARLRDEIRGHRAALRERGVGIRWQAAEWPLPTDLAWSLLRMCGYDIYDDVHCRQHYQTAVRLDNMARPKLDKSGHLDRAVNEQAADVRRALVDVIRQRLLETTDAK